MILTFICFDLLSEKLFNQVPTSNKVSRSEQRRLKKTKSSDTKIFEQKGLVINALVIIMALGIWVYFKDSYYTRFVKINPQVKDIVSKLPPDSLIAGHPLLPDLNTISITTKRKVFVDYERSLAYTKLTLYEIRRRNEVALKLTYAKSKDEFLQLARADGITHYLAFIGFYSPQYLSNPIYIEPYNQLSLNLVKLKPNESFFIEDVLHSKHQDYMLISLDDLK
jgi:hypothetical protein